MALRDNQTTDRTEHTLSRNPPRKPVDFSVSTLRALSSKYVIHDSRKSGESLLKVPVLPMTPKTIVSTFNASSSFSYKINYNGSVITVHTNFEESLSLIFGIWAWIKILK